MRKVFLLFSVLSLFLLSISMVYASENVPGDVLAVFKAEPGTQVTKESLKEGGRDYIRISEIAEELDARVIEFYPALSRKKNMIFVLLHTDSKSEDVLIQELLARDDVISASPNSISYSNSSTLSPVSTNDTYSKDQWGLKAVRVPQVWNITSGELYPFYRIAIIDSGVDYNHPDLAGNFDKSLSKNFVETKGFFGIPNIDPDAYHDENGHGTHVAGIAGAIGNNGIGVSGVNLRTKIISLRVLDENCENSGDSQIIKALDRALDIIEDNDNVIDFIIINMSLRGYESKTPEERMNNKDAYWLAMSELDETDKALICVGAGNEGLEVGEPAPEDDPELNEDGTKRNEYKKGEYIYPASFIGLKNMIVVANARKYNFSRNVDSNYSTTRVDIAAPGTTIWSTFSSQHSDKYRKKYTETPALLRNENGALYYRMDGTSMSAPFVAGAAALIKSKYPDADAPKIKAAILNGANSYYAKDYTKYGFLNIEGAFAYMRGEKVPVGVPIDDVNFPDKNFRFYVSSDIDIDKNGYLSEAEIKGVRSIRVSGRNIKDLTGLEKFPNIVTLDCSNNSIETLHFEVYPLNQCEFKYLQTIDVSNCGNLTEFHCNAKDGNNLGNLTTLKLNGCISLDYIDCSYNRIKKLETGELPALCKLKCASNDITELNLLNYPNLSEIYCNNNELATLNVGDLITDLNLKNQTAYGLKISETDDSDYPYQVDLKSYFSDEEFSRIVPESVKAHNENGTTFSYCEYDKETGIMKFKKNSMGIIYTPYEIRYIYKTNPNKNDEQFLMNVALRVGAAPVIPVEPVSDDTYVSINEANFPDKNFRSYLSGYDSNRDGILSPEEIEVMTYLWISDSEAITNLEGLHFITSLKELVISGNEYTNPAYTINLDLSNCSNLEALYCHYINITSFNSLNVDGCSSLKKFDCYCCGEDDTQTTAELDLSNCNFLQSADFCDIKIATLKLSNCRSLQHLNFRNRNSGNSRSNSLTKLDISNCTNLKKLDCTRINLTNLDASGCNSLVSLDCNYCFLSNLNVKGCNSLEYLDCRNTQLTTLNVSDCIHLKTFYCSSNKLTNLDLKNCTFLEDLRCSMNLLTDLDLSNHTSLKSIDCGFCQLTNLNVRNCTSLTTLYCSNNQLNVLDLDTCTSLKYLYCGDNQLTVLDMSRNTGVSKFSG